MPMNPRLLVPRANFDADAAAYIRAVEAADTQALEAGVKRAIDNFVRGCKQDGIWSAIQVCGILAGARTLAGALVPLKGAAPTNTGPFVAGDYDRETGLKSNGTTKQLDYPFDGSTVGQDDYHLGVYVHTSGSATGLYASHGRAETGATNIAGPGNTSSNFILRCRTSTQNLNVGAMTYPGYVGISRSNGSDFVLRTAGSSATLSRASQAPVVAGTTLFNFSTGAALRSDARISFFSSGTQIDLTQLESRVNALIAAIGSAI